MVFKQGAEHQKISLSFRLEGLKESEMNSKCKQQHSLSAGALLLCFKTINPICLFSKHRLSGPMLSISRNVPLRVRVSVCPSVCLSVCSLLKYCLNVFLPPLPKVVCPIFLEIQYPWGKVMERSSLRFEHFCSKMAKNCRCEKRKKKRIFFLSFVHF